MNLQELDRMLEKYYEGTSSEAEERSLFNALKDSNLPDKYLTDRQIIGGFNNDDFIPEPDSSFESRIMQAIDEDEKNKKVISLKRRVYAVVSVAATVLIVISSWFIMNSNKGIQDTFDDPVLAYNATLEVLQQVSSTMNTGNEAISNLDHIEKVRENLSLINEPAKVVSSKMESLKYLEKSISLFK